MIIILIINSAIIPFCKVIIVVAHIKFRLIILDFNSKNNLSSLIILKFSNCRVYSNMKTIVNKLSKK